MPYLCVLSQIRCDMHRRHTVTELPYCAKRSPNMAETSPSQTETTFGVLLALTEQDRQLQPEDISYLQDALDAEQPLVQFPEVSAGDEPGLAVVRFNLGAFSTEA